MADPILPDHFRVLNVWPSVTGLPEDSVVQTFAFRNDGLGLPFDNIKEALDSFWGDAHAPGVTPLVQFIAGSLVGPPSYRIYDLGQAPPREPTVLASTGVVPPATDAYPGEVALCMSYVADRNLARQRGRIYVGPLVESAGVTADGAVRPADGLRNAMVGAADFLRGGAVDLQWSIISHMDAAAKIITGGWVDNAFDTQRRRGTAASARTLWGPDPGQ